MGLDTALNETTDKDNWINETVDKINGLWKKSVDDVLEACKLLAEAKEYLGGNNKKKNDRLLWEHFLNHKDLNLTQRTIEKLTKIGNWKYIDDESIICKLPPAWSTIYEIVVWSEESTTSQNKFLKAVRNDDIKCDMERSDVARLKNGNQSGRDLGNLKRIVSIEVSADDYKNWDVKKLEEVKTALEKNLKAVESKLAVSVNTSTIDEKIKAIAEKKKKDEDNKDKDEVKVVEKLGKIVNDKLSSSKSLLDSYKSLSEIEKRNEIQKDFHTPQTIDHYVKVLHKEWKVTTDVLSEGKVFTGLFDESFFEKKLEEVSKN